MEKNATYKSDESFKFTTIRADVPSSLLHPKVSCSTWILISCNVLLALTMCVFFVSLNAELNSLRGSCGGEKVNMTSKIGCQNYKTVDNVDETENGLSSSIEMILKQYALTDTNTSDDDPNSSDLDPTGAEDTVECNDTDVFKRVEGNEQPLSRVTRGKNGQRRVLSGFAHFHGGRGVNTNLNVQQVIDIWEAADWVDDTKFKMDVPGGPASRVTVNSRGLYYLYSQVTFKDVNRYHGYTVYVGNEPQLQCYFENPLTQCTGPVKKNGSCSGRREERCAVCYTAGLVYIQKKDEISIEMIFPNRIISGHKADTFFGLLKVK